MWIKLLINIKNTARYPLVYAEIILKLIIHKLR